MKRACSTRRAKRALENKLANLEAHSSKQLMVVTLASARGMTVDDYGLELRKHWKLEPNGRRAMLIVVAEQRTLGHPVRPRAEARCSPMRSRSGSSTGP